MSTGDDEERKPKIVFKVIGHDGNKVFYKMKRSTQMKNLMDVYCDRHSVELSSLVFLYSGWHLGGDQTPDELEMEDDDEIEVMLRMTGGGMGSII